MSVTALTQAEISRRVDEIAAAADDGDDEKAHGLEDALYQDVLQAISHGVRGAPRLAAEALKASDLSFERWLA